MVCINANSAMNPVFQGNGRLCVNVLNHEQEIMARHFAGMTGMTMEERFALSCWQGRWRSRCSRARSPALRAR
jgi:flavin reductase (NADH)